MKRQYKRWQVILMAIGFLMLMGVVGRIDCESQQALLDERVNIRNAVERGQVEDQRESLAYYERQARGDK